MPLRLLVSLMIGLMLTSCKGTITSEYRSSIKVELMRFETPPLVVEMSQRDRPHSRYDLNGKRIKSSQEEASWWKEKQYLKADFAVKLANTSNDTVFLPRESTLAGFYNLTFVVSGKFKEYIIAKKPGHWYSVSQSYHSLKPGESLIIPVALSPYLWQNINAIFNESKELFAIRGQFKIVQDYASDFETVNSPTYSLNSLLPGKEFMEAPYGIKLTDLIINFPKGKKNNASEKIEKNMLLIE